MTMMAGRPWVMKRPSHASGQFLTFVSGVGSCSAKSGFRSPLRKSAVLTRWHGVCGRLKLSDAEGSTLGEIGHRLGRKVLGEVATVGRPDTIMGWYRQLVARKFAGSKARRG